MSGNRKLPDGARRNVAGIRDIPDLSEDLAEFYRSALTETELVSCERAVGLDQLNPAFREAIIDALLMLLTTNHKPPTRAAA